MKRNYLLWRFWRPCAQLLSAFTVGVLSVGCVSYPGNTAVGLRLSSPEPKGEVETVRGVINGLHRYDPQHAEDMMTEIDGHLSIEEVEEYSVRYIVKVGIDREPVIALLSPIVFAKWASYVVLPKGWSYSVSEISSSPRVVNVGDVVELEVQRGRRFDFMVDIVRKCFEEPGEDENPDWNIGCKTYEGFGDKDFVGEYYNFRQF